MADNVPDGYGNVRVSFSGSSRNVTQGDKDNAAITVYFNGNQVEKNGNVFEDRVPTGTRLTITAEAVSADGRIIGKGEETITVRDGTNDVSMKIYTYDNFVVTIDGKATGYTNFTDAWNATTRKTAVIKMNADTSVSASMTVSGNITLDLNGHTLRGNGSASVISISSGTLTLNDSGSVGKITGGGDEGGGVYVSSGATFTMNAGTISGNTVVDQGGGVYNEGTFTMNGGAISNNTVRDDTGGGVKNNGIFTMNGGTISGNTCNLEGGGVCNNTGSFTMNGGYITGNNGGGTAGGVYNGTTFIMNNGTISGNTALNGGGVEHTGTGTFTMKGGTISGNTATEHGGGVWLYQGTFVKTGGTVRGNTAPSGGGSQLYVGAYSGIANPSSPPKYDLGQGEQTVAVDSNFALDTAF